MKLKAIASIFAICALFGSTVDAYAENERINWFYKTQSDNTRPDILGGKLPENSDVALYLGPEDDKTVYLTFDAGYSNDSVESILDTLKEKDVRGAFFILPGIIKNSPETVKRMADEGHLVCNHTTSHGDMSKISNIDEFKAELSGVERAYYELTGREMEKYFRPPEGAFSVKTLSFCKELGYTPVFWSFAYADWDNGKQPSPDYAKEKILAQAHDGMVMLLHPTSQTNASVLPDVIDELRNRGYCFGSLDDLKQKLIESN